MPRRSGKLSFIRAVDYQRRVAGLSRGRQGEQGSLQKVVTLAGDRGFESISLQRGVLCEAYFRARGTEGSKLSLSSEEARNKHATCHVAPAVYLTRATAAARLLNVATVVDACVKYGMNP